MPAAELRLAGILLAESGPAGWVIIGPPCCPFGLNPLLPEAELVGGEGRMRAAMEKREEEKDLALGVRVVVSG